MKPTEYLAVESASGLVELQAGRTITLDKPELVEDLLGAGYIVKNAKGLTLEKARVIAAEARAAKRAAREAAAASAASANETDPAQAVVPGTGAAPSAPAADDGAGQASGDGAAPSAPATDDGADQAPGDAAQ